MTRRRKGFTILELNLSMIFVALLLLGIAALSIHVTRIYQRGVLLKDVNYVGREIMGQLRRDIASADSTRVMTRVTNHAGQIQSGRICLGDVSYLYNTPVGLQNNIRARLIVRGNGLSDAPRISLARVTDPDRRWCDLAVNPSGQLPTHITETHFTAGTNELSATELISRDRFALVSVHRMALTMRRDPRTTDSSAQYAQLNLWLGTSDLSAIDATGQSCRPPSDNSSDFSHCFVTDYSTIIRVGGQQ